MKLSRNFTRTTKDIPSDEVSKNAQLLIKAGFIHKTMAGVYSYLPLGLRVINKIENIIRENLNQIGGQEVLMNSLHPKEWWLKTDRWDADKVDVLFRLQSQTKSEYALACSHEEQVTPIAKDYIKSFKDLRDYDAGIDFSQYLICTVINCGDLDFNNLEKYVVWDEFFRNGERVNQSIMFHKESYQDFFTRVELKLEILSLDIYETLTFKCVKRIISYENNVSELNPDDGWLKFKTHLIAMDKFLGEPPKDYTEADIAEELRYKYIEKPDTGNAIIFEKFATEKPIYPLAIYQIQTKFRDELRSKSGIMRGREFRMKDMYDFHQNQESADSYYEVVKQKYFEIYQDLGLKAYAVHATGGMFTDNDSHEFQVVCDAGEDVIYYNNQGYAINEDIREDLIKRGESIPEGLTKAKSAEVGNIFKLGDKYTQAFDLKFTDTDNTQKYPIMNCHGIGTSRCMGVIAELHSDDKGLKWPLNVAPYQVHLITHLGKDEEINRKILAEAEAIYSGIGKQVGDVKIYSGEVLWDDRNSVSLGVKFKDADLIGCPVQIVITERTIARGEPEVRVR